MSARTSDPGPGLKLFGDQRLLFAVGFGRTTMFEFRRQRWWRVGNKIFEGGGDHLAGTTNGLDLQFGEHVLRNVFQVGFVAPGENDAMNAGTVRGEDLFLNPTHRKDEARKRDLACHSGVGTHAAA